MHALIRLFIGFGCAMAQLGLCGCPFPPKIYRMDIRQGNFLTPELISKLKVGMSKEQVQNILGSPTLTHFLQQDRWDYYYYLKPGNGDPIIEKKLFLYFKSNVVQRVVLEEN